MNIISKLSVWPSKVSIWLNWYYRLCPVHACCSDLHPWLQWYKGGTHGKYNIHVTGPRQFPQNTSHLIQYKASSCPSRPQIYRCLSEHWAREHWSDLLFFWSVYFTEHLSTNFIYCLQPGHTCRRPSVSRFRSVSSSCVMLSLSLHVYLTNIITFYMSHNCMKMTCPFLLL